MEAEAGVTFLGLSILPPRRPKHVPPLVQQRLVRLSFLAIPVDGQVAVFVVPFVVCFVVKVLFGDAEVVGSAAAAAAVAAAVEVATPAPSSTV